MTPVAAAPARARRVYKRLSPGRSHLIMMRLSAALLVCVCLAAVLVAAEAKPQVSVRTRPCRWLVSSIPLRIRVWR